MLCASLREDRSRVGFRNIVCVFFFLILDDEQILKKGDCVSKPFFVVKVL